MLGTRDGRWWLRWWLAERRWVVAVLLLAGVLALMGAVALVVTAATAGSVVGLVAAMLGVRRVPVPPQLAALVVWALVLAAAGSWVLLGALTASVTMAVHEALQGVHGAEPATAARGSVPPGVEAPPVGAGTSAIR